MLLSKLAAFALKLFWFFGKRCKIFTFSAESDQKERERRRYFWYSLACLTTLITDIGLKSLEWVAFDILVIHYLERICVLKNIIRWLAHEFLFIIPRVLGSKKKRFNFIFIRRRQIDLWRAPTSRSRISFVRLKVRKNVWRFLILLASLF